MLLKFDKYKNLSISFNKNFEFLYRTGTQINTDNFFVREMSLLKLKLNGIHRDHSATLAKLNPTGDGVKR